MPCVRRRVQKTQNHSNGAKVGLVCNILMKRTIWLLTCALAGLLIPEHWVCGAVSGDKPPQGSYRFPSVYGDSIVFTAEGDLWRGGVLGGQTQWSTRDPRQAWRAACRP